MRWRKNVVLLLAAVGIIAAVVAIGADAATGPRLHPQVFYPVKADVSPAIRSIPVPLAPKGVKPHERVQPGDIVRPATAPVTDPVVQRSAGAPNTPAPLLSIEGYASADNGALIGGYLTPADTEGAVGGLSPASNVYIQWVNVGFKIFDKTTGATLAGPLPGNIFWTGFGGGCESNNDGDIIVLYDKLADRWLFSQFSVSSSPYKQCFAISTSPDPLGTYYRYEINMGGIMPDYPKLSVWADAYYGTCNQFYGGSGAGFWALERNKMLTGDPTAALIFFNLGAPYGGDLPVDFDGPAPAGGTPGIFVEVDKAGWIPGLSEDSLLIWYLTPDWANPANSCLGDSCTGNPNETVPVATFNAPLCGGNRNCIPQPPGGEGLDTLSDRIMYRAAARDVTVLGHKSLVINHSVDAGGGIAGVRWYELQSMGAWDNWSVAQQGTYSPDSTHRWMGSIGIDYVGDIAVGYSASSSSVFTSVRYAGRTPGDPLGFLDAEQEIVAGDGVTNTGYNRWGDYSAIQVDPVDQCTFWYTTMYDRADDNLPPYPGWMWNTRIGSFKFANCSIGPQGTITGTVTSFVTGDPIPGALVTAGSASTLTNGSGVYTLTLPVSGSPYDMTASKFGFGMATATGIVVTEDGTTIQDFALQPVGESNVSGNVVAAGHGWPLYAKLTITAPSTPTTTVYTDPATGSYTVTLFNGYDYTFDVEAVYPGYAPQSRPVSVSGMDQVQNFTLAPDGGCSAWGFAPGYFWYTDFEANNGGFTVSGSTSWAWGVPTSGPGSAHSGSKVWATNLSGNYNTLENGYITSPVIDLSSKAGERVIVEWWQWLRSEQSYDYASIEASKDGGATWAVFYGPVSGAIDAAWTKHQAILSPDYATANFRVRFHFTTDSSVNYPGWYVDDVGVFTQPIPPPTVKFTTDLEANNGSFVAAGTNSDWAWGAPTSGPGAAHSGVNVWATNLTGNYATSENSTLTSPVIDLSTESGKTITLSWWQYLRTESGFDPVYVEVTANGSTWTTVYGPVSGSIDLVWTQRSVQLSDAYATANFQFRFHFTSDSSISYPGWYIDDPQVSTSAPIPPPAVDCNPVGGTIVYGFAADANTGLRLDGVEVENDLGLSTRTGSDVNLGPGYYAFFTPMPGLSPSLAHTFTASMDKYADDVHVVDLVPNTVQRLDFSLGAGWLSISPAQLISRLYATQDEHQALSLRNDGVLAGAFMQSAIPIKMTWPHASPVVQGNGPHGPKSIGHARVHNVTPGRPGTMPYLQGVPAFGVDLQSTNLVTWPDVLVPGGWQIIASEPGSSYFGGAFLMGDFSRLFVLDYAANTLSTLDTTTGAPTLVGPAPTSGGESWTGLTATTTGTMYASATTCSSSTLYTIDPESGATTVVGPITNAPCLIDISANAAGELYGVDLVNDNLIKIDPASGAGTVIGSTGINANYAQGLSFDQVSGVLYWAAYNASAGGELRVIDTNTGASTLIGAFPGGTEVDAFAIQTFAGGGGGLPWLVLDPTEGSVDTGNTLPIDAHFIADGADHFGLFRANIKTNTDTPYDVDNVSVCFTKAFSDVPAGYWADGRVHSIAAARITTGCGSDNFCPDNVMTRGVMARWLLLARFGNLYSPPPCTGIFADVVCESTPNADFIEALYNEGITAGCGTDPLRYCPDAPVTRGEMSVFILKAQIDPEYRPPACTGIFNDVACPSMFGNWIEDLFNRQITAGCGGGNFCPDQATTRAEESVFVGKAWSIPMCTLIPPDKPVK